MKNSFETACRYPEFVKWLKEYEHTANFFVATVGASTDQLHALRLCVAAAFLSGKATQ